MFFALFVFSKLTSLGDTWSYLDGNVSDYLILYIHRTELMIFFAGTLNKVFGLIFANTVFVTMSFYGIYYSVSRIKLTNKQLLLVLLLLSFPSFGIWTSIASKEAVGVFYMGIVVGYLIDLLENKGRKIKFIEYIAFYLLLLFKPQYLLAILSIWVYIKFSYLFNLQSLGKSVLFLMHVLVIIFILYYFRDLINEVSFILPNNFSLNAGSTRENTIWVHNYDIFRNALYGMLLAFWGPTFSEIIVKPLQSVVFFESLVIFLFFLYFTLKASMLVVQTGKVNIYYFSIFFMAVFWLLFVHYPFGVLNPGSAIRYRENFYGFLVVLLFYLYQKIKLRYEFEKNSHTY